MLVAAVLLLVVVLGVGVTGCEDLKQAAPSAKPASPATTTAATGKLPTIVRPESNSDAWLLASTPIERGSDIHIYTELNSPSEGAKNICGAVNYYIDDCRAGGEWHVTSGDICQSIAGWLHLTPADTMRLARGAHTLKIEYLGNDTYAASQFIIQFTVK